MSENKHKIIASNAKEFEALDKAYELFSESVTLEQRYQSDIGEVPVLVKSSILGSVSGKPAVFVQPESVHMHIDKVRCKDDVRLCDMEVGESCTLETDKFIAVIHFKKEKEE